MRHTPRYLMTEPAEVKRLVRGNPWATFVSATSNGLIASHYPVLLDETADDIAVFSHFGRPDDELHELGQHQMLVIIQGPHDYVSPSWYAPGDLVPTWTSRSSSTAAIPHSLPRCAGTCARTTTPEGSRRRGGARVPRGAAP